MAVFITCNSQLHFNKQNCSSVLWDFLSVPAQQKDGDISSPRHLELEPCKAVFMRLCHVLSVPSVLCRGWHKAICCRSVYLVLHTVPCSREERKALGPLLSSPGRGIMTGSRASTVAGAAAHISAAHITDNLLRSARSIRNKVLPTLLPCWHPSFQFPSARRFPGHQLCSQLLVLFTYHPRPGTSLLRSCPLIQALRAGRLPLQNTCPYIFCAWMSMCMHAMYKIIRAQLLQKIIYLP